MQARRSPVNKWRRRADKFDVRDWLYPYDCGAGRGARNAVGQGSRTRTTGFQVIR
jgi:hypothetical protein